MTAIMRRRRRDTEPADSAARMMALEIPLPPFEPLSQGGATGGPPMDVDHRLAAVVRRSPYLTTILTEDGLIDFQSSPTADLLGYDAENMVGVSFSTLVSSEDAARWEQFFERIATGTPREATTEWALRRSDGTFARVESTIINFLDDPEIAGVVVLSRPIGDVRDYVPVRAVVPYPTSLAVEVAPADWSVVPEAVAFPSSDQLAATWEQPVDEQAVAEVEPCDAADPEPVAADPETEQQALRDPLTALATWALFRDRLDQAVARAERTEEKLAVILVDIGDETAVADDGGGGEDDEHVVSDEVLRAIAGRLVNTVRVGETVARFDRRRFGILPDGTSTPNFERLGARIFEGFRNPLYVDGAEVFVKASIGMATTESGYESAGELLAHAEVAVQSAKATGSDCFENYANGLHGQVVSHPVPVSETGAFIRNEMIFHYQPIFELESGDMIAVEALLRWNHPRRGLVMPAEFLPIAEKSGQIRSLAGWALPTVCREARNLQHETEMPDLGVSLNLSRQEFDHPGLVDDVAAALAESGLAPRLLTLEIAEAALMSDVDSARPILESLRALGVRVSLDDYGTGGSSLADLGHIPVDELKIDPSLVAETTAGDRPATLLSAIASLANSLGLRTVAEGVETEEHLAHARRAGCKLAQGYLLGRPMEAQRLNRSVARAARLESPFAHQIAILNDILEKTKGRPVEEDATPSPAVTEFGSLLDTTG